MILQDAVTLERTSRSYTSEGFLEATAVICRTGIQEYRGSELPGLNLDPQKVYRIYRPPQAVFDQESMTSFKRRPLTNEHPYDVGGLLTTDTARIKTVGSSGDLVRRDGDTLVVDVTFWDAQAIKDIEAGKTGLSNGYTLAIDMIPGVTPEGESYDGIQKNIRGNHIALCASDEARGGKQCRLLDQKNLGVSMKEDLPNLSDLSQLGQMMQMMMERLDQMSALLQPAEDKPADPAPADNGDDGLDGDAVDDAGDPDMIATDSAVKRELEHLKGQLASFKALDVNKLVSEKVSARVHLLDKARSVVSEIDNNLSDLDIKKQVIKKLNPAICLDSASEAYITGCFDSAVATYEGGAHSARDLGVAIQQSVSSQIKNENVFALVDSGEHVEAARQRRVERNRNAWKRGAK